VLLGWCGGLAGRGADEGGRLGVAASLGRQRPGEETGRGVLRRGNLQLAGGLLVLTARLSLEVGHRPADGLGPLLLRPLPLVRLVLIGRTLHRPLLLGVALIGPAPLGPTLISLLELPLTLIGRALHGLPLRLGLTLAGLVRIGLALVSRMLRGLARDGQPLRHALAMVDLSVGWVLLGPPLIGLPLPGPGRVGLALSDLVLIGLPLPQPG
jgi:hypothetical protein